MMENTDTAISQDETEDRSGNGTADSTTEAPRRSRLASLGQMVADAGILTAEEISDAQETSWKDRLPLGRVLVKEGMMLSKDLATLIALHLGLAMVDLRSERIDQASVQTIPEDIA